MEVGAGSGPFPVYWGDSLVHAGVFYICVCCDSASSSSTGPPSSRVQPPELCLWSPRIPDGVVNDTGCFSCGRRNADRKVEGHALRRLLTPLTYLGVLLDDLSDRTPTQPGVLQTFAVVLVLCSIIEQVRWT